MLSPFKKILLAGCYTALCLPITAAASNTLSPENTRWANWFTEQISQHPQVWAARQSMLADLSLANSREQPLYNPELETEYEREGDDDNFRIGLSQTIDWWGKREVRTQQANFSSLAAKASYQQALQQTTADALLALIRWQSAKQRASLAQEQEAQLDTLLELINQRQRAGDLGEIDTEIAYLSLSQNLNSTAQTISAFKKAEAELRAMLPGWTESAAQIPEQLWSDGDPQNGQWLDTHPKVTAARTRWSVLQQGSELARRETKAEPRFGINAGQSGEDDVIALTFSMPLNVRNNYSAEARAADDQALAAEARYHAIRRQQQAGIEAAGDTLLTYQQQYQRWQTLMGDRGQRSLELLAKQWRSNDMSTTEYLLASQQRNQGLLAGIELQENFQAARVNWLLQTGTINAALAQLAQ